MPVPRGPGGVSGSICGFRLFRVRRFWGSGALGFKFRAWRFKFRFRIVSRRSVLFLLEYAAALQDAAEGAFRASPY